MSALPARKVGRPSSFDPDELPLVTRLCMLGLTNAQLAPVLSVDEATIGRWIKNNPEFCAAVKAGRVHADGAMAASLYSRGMGYSHPEEKIFYDTKTGEEVRVQTTKHYPPDTAAAFIWLKNRRPDLWRDVKQTEVTGKDGGPLEIAPSRQLEPRERDKLRRFLEAKVVDVELLEDDQPAEEGQDDGGDEGTAG